MGDQEAMMQTSPEPSPWGNHYATFFILADLFLLVFMKTQQIATLSWFWGHISLASCLKREAPAWLSDTGMDFHSIFRTSNCIRQVNSIFMKSPITTCICAFLFIFPSLHWMLPPSKGALGPGRKLQVQRQKPLHLLAEEILKALKTENTVDNSVSANHPWV